MAMGFAAGCNMASIPTIAVHIRGTDQWTEVAPAPIGVFFSRVDAWLEATPGSQVLIQTDQAQTRAKFVERHGSRCTFIRELPVTSGTVVMHDSEDLVLKKSEFAVLLCAMWEALSEAKALVTRTSGCELFSGN